MFKRNVIGDADFNVLVNTDEEIDPILPPNARYVRLNGAAVVDLKKIPASLTEHSYEWILRDELNDN